jgi:Zn-dependent protease
MLHLFQGGFDPGLFVTWILALALGITVHEFAHAWRADKAGDPTPRSQGRLSLNPLAHYDPIGSTMILLFGLGWAKPVPVNPFLFKHPRRDEIMVSLWGPIANIITAAVLAIPIRLGIAGAYEDPLMWMMTLNLGLAVFNLIPVYPLDGSHVLSALLPLEQSRRLDAVYHQYGIMLLVVVMLFAGNYVWFAVDLLRLLLAGK